MRAQPNLVAGDVCFIRAGLYRETLAPTHSGTSQAPIVFQPWSNEVVRISGADVVTGWKYWSKQSYAAPAGWDLGNGYNQVFVDGRMVHQARFPNFGARGLLQQPCIRRACGQLLGPRLVQRRYRRVLVLADCADYLVFRQHHYS
jgi:hypothetical protein